jgi:RimJ/RimL family protein N-acetyltransferase
VTTKAVLLRDARDEDLPTFYEHQLDPEASEMAAFPSRDHHAFMAAWTKIMSDDTAVKKAIVADDMLVGNALSWLADDRRLIGYWIGKEHWGKGIATAAVRSLVSTIRERPLYAFVATNNLGSIRVLEKCGFTTVPGSRTVASDGIEEVLLTLV